MYWRISGLGGKYCNILVNYKVKQKELVWNQIWVETKFGRKAKVGENQSWMKTKVELKPNIIGKRSWAETKVSTKGSGGQSCLETKVWPISMLAWNRSWSLSKTIFRWKTQLFRYQRTYKVNFRGSQGGADSKVRRKPKFGEEKSGTKVKRKLDMGRIRSCSVVKTKSKLMGNKRKKKPPVGRQFFSVIENAILANLHTRCKNYLPPSYASLAPRCFEQDMINSGRNVSS